MERQTHIDRVAAVFVVACCLFWGFQQVLIKAIVGEVPPLWQASIRFAGATVLLGVWCRVRGVPLFARDGTLRAGLLAGVLFAGEFTCIYLGLRDTSASRLTVFLYTAPFVVALLLRMTSVVRPQSKPPSKATASPRSWLAAGVGPNRPSAKAKATAPNASTSPAHWVARRRSVGTSRGSSKATTKGAV